EDGIRDFHVTGVQTCALPIFGFINFFLEKIGVINEPVRWLLNQDYALLTIILTNIWLGIPFNVILLASGLTGLPEDIYEAATVRSEERRVGKEGRAGWAAGRR